MMYRKRWRLRFSVRVLLLLFTSLTLATAFVAHRTKRHLAAVNRVRELGGRIHYDYQMDESTGRYYSAKKRYQVKPYGPAWLRRMVGDELFNTPVMVSFSNSNLGDDDLVVLADLPRLKWVGLEKTNVSDQGLRHLVHLKELTDVFLNDTNVTDAGAKSIQDRMPSANVHYLTTAERAMAKERFKHFTFGSYTITGGPECSRLGVRFYPGGRDLDTIHEGRAPRIQSVAQGSPADLAGIEQNDTIVGVNDRVIVSDMRLIEMVDSLALGEEIDVTVVRGKKRSTLSAVLDGS